jgi:hypothetical protein
MERISKTAFDLLQHCRDFAKEQMIQKSVEGTEELKLYTIFSQLGPSRRKVLEE